MSLSSDSSTVCMTSAQGMVLVDVIEILSARQWWLKTGRETTELDARVFETYTSGPRQATFVSSRDNCTQEHSLYKALMSASKRTRGDGAPVTGRHRHGDVHRSRPSDRLVQTGSILEVKRYHLITDGYILEDAVWPPGGRGHHGDPRSCVTDQQWHTRRGAPRGDNWFRGFEAFPDGKAKTQG